MTKLRLAIALVAVLIAVGVLTSVATAQQGVTIFTGTVSIDGAPAPSGTSVIISLEDGTQIAATTTGQAGLNSNQYRFDLQVDPALNGRVVVISVPNTAQPATATFVANRVIVVNVNASTPVATATPVPTATPAPTPTPRPTATSVPTATPVPTSTPLPTATATSAPTATPVPTSTPLPTATATSAPTATPVPTPTLPAATATPVEEEGGGGCNAPLHSPDAPLDAGWVVLGLAAPGAAFLRFRHWRKRRR